MTRIHLFSAEDVAARKAFVQRIVSGVLEENIETLNHWRRARPNRAKQVKNFENWLLVKMVEELFAADAEEVCTNGCFHRQGVHLLKDLCSELPAERVEALGGKNRSQSVSPDVAFKKGDWNIEIELKTQGAFKVLNADLAVVEAVNNVVDDGALSCFVWVVAAPRTDVDRHFRRVARLADDLGVELTSIGSVDWLQYAVAAPGA